MTLKRLGARIGSRVPALAGLRAWQLLVAALILGELAVRGPIRALEESRDLTVHFGAARVWVAGGNPYDMAEVGDAFEAAGGPHEQRPTASTMPSVYPPVTLAVEAPLALLDWKTAVVLFTGATLALVVVALLRFARWAGLVGRGVAVAVLGALALAPLHTGLGAGQVAIPSIALLLLGWTFRRERPALAGVLLALGVALKPSLAAPFLVACATRPSLPLALAGAGTFGALLAVGTARLALAGVDASHAWPAAVAATFAPGGMNHAFGIADAIAPMIHLSPLLGRFGFEPTVVTAMVLAATVPTIALAAWRLRDAPDRGTELAALGALCVASLLSTYHRTYDAFLLVVPLAALLAARDALGRPLRVGIAVCLAAFLLPGAPFLHALARSGFVPEGLAASATWELLVVPHQIWALLALELAFTAVLLPRRATATASVPL
jgi:hypothetical protein